MKPLLPIVCALLSVVSTAACADEKLKILDKGGQELASYSLSDLEASYTVSDLKTTTPWTGDTMIVYRGAPMKEILKKYGIDKSTVVKAIATDDYFSDISHDDIEKYDPIIATQIGCVDEDYEKSVCMPSEQFRALTDADRGPFYIVWPQNKLPTSTTESENHRWVWFLTGLQEK